MSGTHPIANAVLSGTTNVTGELKFSSSASVSGLYKRHIGLQYVDNTSDATKPISGPQKNYVDSKISAVTGFTQNTIEALNSIGEIAASIGNNPNFQADTNAALALKATAANPTFTGTVKLPTGAGVLKSSLAGVVSSSAVSQTDLDAGLVSRLAGIDSAIAALQQFDASFVVTTDRIQDGAVTTAKIANGAVTTDKIANSAVTLTKIQDVSAGHIIIGSGLNKPSLVTISGDATISVQGMLTIGSGAVTSDKLATNINLSGNPTAPTQDVSNNSTSIATTAFVSRAIANLVGTAPELLNTLEEIADSINKDANFNDTMVGLLATKANASEMTTALAAKANASDMTSALALKANASDVESALALKADSAATTSALALKADSAATTSALALKANASDMTSALAAKANASDVESSLALKADSAATTSALALKANASDMTSALALKADSATMTSALALKADSAAMSTALAAKANASSLALKANIASPGFTGIPTAPTANIGVSTTQIATTAFVSNAIASLVDSAPATLNTLNDLALALGSDANFSTTITNALAAKANASDMTTALAAKANASDMTTALAAKANASDVESSLALKADASEMTTALAAKANASDMTSALAAKANASDVESSLALKADAAATTSALAAKANASEMTTALAAKANADDMTTALDLKADTAELTTLGIFSATDNFEHIFVEANSLTYQDAQPPMALPIQHVASTINHTSHKFFPGKGHVGNRDGWYFKNTAGASTAKSGNNKINWYYQTPKNSEGVRLVSGLNELDLALKIFMSASPALSILPPQITVYTKPKGDGQDFSWYRTRRTYLVPQNITLTAGTNYLFRCLVSGSDYEGTKSGFTTINLEPLRSTLATTIVDANGVIIRSEANMTASSVIRPFEANEEIMFIAVGSDSSAAAGRCEFFMYNVEMLGPDGNIMYHHSNENAASHYFTRKIADVCKATTLPIPEYVVL